jgi:hypothetical protein
MKVYCLFSYYASDTGTWKNLLGVYKTAELAQAQQDELTAQETNKDFIYYYEEWPMNVFSPE